jgi:hypothetical protein
MQQITIDNKQLTLRLTAGAFRRFQSAIGKQADFDAIGGLIFDCIRRDQPDITEAAFEDMLDAETLRTVWQAVQKEMEAFGAALNPTTASEAPASTGGETLPSPALN